MRKTILLSILLFSISLLSQEKDPDCYEFMNFEQNENFCDTIHLTNSSKLYYQWNCDTTWLTFENKECVILKSCNDIDPILCSRIGLNFIKEYPNYLLFIDKLVSGCCDTPDLVFIDKENGKELKRITNEYFIWGDADENYSLYFPDTTQNNLIYIDHNTDIGYETKFKKKQVSNSARKNHVNQLSELFDNFKKNDNELTFDFKSDDKKTIKMAIKLK